MVGGGGGVGGGRQAALLGPAGGGGGRGSPPTGGNHRQKSQKGGKRGARGSRRGVLWRRRNGRQRKGMLGATGWGLMCVVVGGARDGSAAGLFAIRRRRRFSPSS